MLTGEVGNGRFAPSPTGELHVGNLRTALIAWMRARSTGGSFVLRFEDLDRVTSRTEHQRRQLDDLLAIGVEFDGEPLVQSTRFDAHHDAIDQLIAGGQTYECFCSRREIADAVRAPNGLTVASGYPGTCRELTRREVSDRRTAGRPPAIRLRGDGTTTISDLCLGTHELPIGDVVLRRNDGVPSYNLAVVVDDAYQGVEEVVRADDLFSSSAPQARIAELLHLAPVSYAHVPLVVSPSGVRLAKRDGAVTLSDLQAIGVHPMTVREILERSLGDAASGGPTALDITQLPRSPWVLTPDAFSHDRRGGSVGLPEDVATGSPPTR